MKKVGGKKQSKELRMLRRNSTLSQLYPLIAAEWDYDNNEMTPDDYKANSGEIVSWVCPKGHRYETAINKRTGRGDGCYICSGKRIIPGINDLGTLRTELMEEWDFDKNLWIYPTEIGVMSNKKVWWICKDCGNSWQAAISNRTRGSGCSKCRYRKSVQARAGKTVRYSEPFGKLFPELLEEWDYEKNKDIVDPMKVTRGSAIKVWWKCKKCGYEWQATINNRSRGSGCYICTHREAPLKKHRKP